MNKILKVFLVFGLCIGLTGCGGKKDNTKLSDKEVQAYLEDEGYIFEVSDLSSSVNTHYVIIRNDTIWIQKIDNPYTGLMLTFKDNDINSEHADIINKEENETSIQKEQYDAYINWLDTHGLTKVQLQNVLDYYDANNK